MDPFLNQLGEFRVAKSNVDAREMGKIEGQNQVKMGEKRKGGGRRKKGGKGRGGCGLFYVDNLVLM